MKPKFALLATAVAALLSGCAAISGAPYQETRQFDVPYYPDSGLQVVAHNGAIHVQAGSGDAVTVSATLQSGSETRLEEAEVLAERQADNTLAISVRWPDGRERQRDGASFDISLPQAAGVNLHTSNGALQISGLSGQAWLETSNGRISVREHEGDVTARTSNGRLSLEQISGSVRATTTNGSILISLQSDATTAYDISARTTNGAITLEPGHAMGGELKLSTTNGQLNLDTGRLPPATIHEIGKNRLHLSFDDSQQRTVAATTNGSITIR